MSKGAKEKPVPFLIDPKPLLNPFFMFSILVALAVLMVINIALFLFSKVQDPIEEEDGEESSERISHDEEFLWRKSVNP